MSYVDKGCLLWVAVHNLLATLDRVVIYYEYKTRGLGWVGVILNWMSH